ncbi:alpha/beta fold hydrolase [Streptomyces sp. NPDC021100]|uniref:alpha/beta fold hydrolase n=1 Tax=Streptomyces sp. NPDC021100 TaxID=3365114 RepID=UPI0037A21109
MLRRTEPGLRVDIRGLLPRITAPTLVVGFADDAMIPFAGSRDPRAAIPGSRLVESPGQGHMDWFADPNEPAFLTRAFLDGTTAPAA